MFCLQVEMGACGRFTPPPPLSLSLNVPLRGVTRQLLTHETFMWLSLCLLLLVLRVELVCRTVSKIFYSCFVDLRLDVVWNHCECVARPQVTQCG